MLVTSGYLTLQQKQYWCKLQLTASHMVKPLPQQTLCASCVVHDNKISVWVCVFVLICKNVKKQ